jgi:hypothetical protein
LEDLAVTITQFPHLLRSETKEKFWRMAPPPSLHPHHPMLPPPSSPTSPAHHDHPNPPESQTACTTPTSLHEQLLDYGSTPTPRSNRTARSSQAEDPDNNGDGSTTWMLSYQDALLSPLASPLKAQHPQLCNDVNSSGTVSASPQQPKVHSILVHPDMASCQAPS